ncbi:cytochrome P450 family protein [Ceratobasidium sp. AG-Ba]|nr:cytochrome P450 family protein [Ceratobasidium sp. AG-Ba]
MLSCVYGYKASYPHDPLVGVMEIATEEMAEAALPANFYVNIIPWLKYVPSWFPGAGWKRKANEWRANKDRAFNEPFDWTKSQIAANLAAPSIVNNLLAKMANKEMRSQGNIEEEEDVIRWVAGTLLPAGSDTTVSSMSTFILAMILHPEIQTRVQKELDAVIGDRLPELEDRESLPYFEAVLKEIMRWRPVGPTGIPHVCSKDDTYKGFRIPKGAIIIPNIWAMSHDEAVYPNPQDFNPDRFLDLELPSAPVFGFGRRECSGSHFAQSNLFILASTLLCVFNVVATPGKPAPQAKTNTSSLITYPLPFDSTLVPRSESRRRLIQEWLEI